MLTSEELANVPFLVLGNKIDLGRAASEEDLRYQLGLYETYGKEVSSHSGPAYEPNNYVVYIICRQKVIRQSVCDPLSFTCAPLSRKWDMEMVR